MREVVERERRYRALERAGLLIESLREPAPPDDAGDRAPFLALTLVDAAPVTALVLQIPMQLPC